jgi:hypothetical protein
LRSSIAMAALVLTALAARWPAAQAERVLAITNVSVVDVVKGATQSDHTILITGNRIRSVGPAAHVRIPAGADILDASRKFAIPGLWDMHSHVVGFGPASLDLYLAHGVTNVRDMGAERFAEAKSWRDKIAVGQLLGPRMRIASPVVENPRWLAAVKRMSEQAGTPWTLYERFGPKSPQEAVEWVDSIAALGADHVKVRNWPAPEIGRALVERAKLRGLPVVAHPNEPFPRTGITTFEHHVWPPLTGSDSARHSLWQRFAAGAIAMVPTLVTWPVRLDSPDALIERLESGKVAGMEYVPAATREKWRNQLVEFKQEQPMDWLAIHQGEMRNVAEMHKAGMTLLAGTDIGVAFVIPGLSLHEELSLLVTAAGMSPVQALRGATTSSARVVGAADSLGSIEAGKIADLVLLDANPLLDIRNTKQIRAVITDGRLLNRAALDGMLAAAESSARDGTR